MEQLKLNSTTNSLTTRRNFMYNDYTSKSPVENNLQINLKDTNEKNNKSKLHSYKINNKSINSSYSQDNFS